MDSDVKADYVDMEEDDYNSAEENSMLGSEEDGDSEGSVGEEPAKIAKTNDMRNGHTDSNSIVTCENCGTLGIRHAFYAKLKRFCSLTCSRRAASLQEDHKQDVSATDGTLNQSDELKATNTAKKKKPLGKKAKKQMSNSVNSDLNGSKPFDWIKYIKQTNCQTCPVSCFKHCPAADIWEKITAGMKVEVPNLDSELPDGVYWIATVIQIAGYKALMRYEGFGSDASHDFWLNLCMEDVHPIGWCANIGKPLIPPKTIQNKYVDWKDFLVKRLTGARTLPNNFHDKVAESLTDHSLKSGMKVEVVDKTCVSAMRVATVDDIIGGRLRLRYVNSMDEEDDFWCHMRSAVVHHVGWAQTVGHILNTSTGYKKNSVNVVTTGVPTENESTADMFPQIDCSSPDSTLCFKEGMKLEAIDPLSLGSICVASVKKVLSDNYLMIGIDGAAAADGSDWFCYHANSPCIFHVGFCEINNLELTPPRECTCVDRNATVKQACHGFFRNGHMGFSQNIWRDAFDYEGQFNWFDYLKHTKSVAAPVKLFNQEVPAHGFTVGMKLEAVDLMEPRLICVGTVSKVVGRLLLIHFDGWDHAYDQWVDCCSPDIYPLGWCEMVGYHLEGPQSNQFFSPITSAMSNKKRKTKNPIYKGSWKKKRKSQTPGGKLGPKPESGVRICGDGVSSPTTISPVSPVNAESGSSQSQLSVEVSTSSSSDVKSENAADDADHKEDMPTLCPRPVPPHLNSLQIHTESPSSPRPSTSPQPVTSPRPSTSPQPVTSPQQTAASEDTSTAVCDVLSTAVRTSSCSQIPNSAGVDVKTSSCSQIADSAHVTVPTTGSS